MKKIMKSSDGMYHIHGKAYPLLIGSRPQVWHGNAYKTEGNLTKDNLLQNKHGRIVSKKKHHTAKREKRLVKAGYLTKKGVFGFIKKGKTMKKKSRKTRGRK